jgi:hypothetical protein
MIRPSRATSDGTTSGKSWLLGLDESEEARELLPQEAISGMATSKASSNKRFLFMGSASFIAACG